MIGFLHRQVQSVIQQPDNPWLVIGLIVAALAAGWAAGEIFLRKMKAS